MSSFKEALAMLSAAREHPHDQERPLVCADAFEDHGSPQSLVLAHGLRWLAREGRWPLRRPGREDDWVWVRAGVSLPVRLGGSYSSSDKRCTLPAPLFEVRMKWPDERPAFRQYRNWTAARSFVGAVYWLSEILVALHKWLSA